MKSVKNIGLIFSGLTSAFVSTVVIAGVYVPKAQAAKINLVTNGSFDQDSLLNPNDPTRTNPYITGWFNSTADQQFYTTSLDNYTVDNPENGSLSARIATYYVDGPGGPSDPVPTFTYLSQVLDTKKNKEYQLTYYLANSDFELDNEFRTYVNGQLIDDKVNLAGQDFTKYTVNFVATSKKTELKFSARQSGDWFNLDNVSVFRVKNNHNYDEYEDEPTLRLASVEPVPEPLTLGGTAIAGLLGLWLKRKQVVSE